jgi:hypothetical protein
MAIMPRYTSSDIAVGTPQGQFRDVSAPMDQLSSQMDRMTGFFIQEAKQQAVVEGEKYAADKAPTREQIELAVSTGTPLPQVGDSTTLFGRAAQKASAEIVSTQISYAALEELQKVKLDMESGSVAPNAGLKKINAMVEGYSSALSEIDPTAAKKLEAELAYRGNITYVAASKAAASAAAKQAKDAYELKLATDLNGISDLVSSGETIDKNGKIITLDEKRELSRQSIVSQAAKLGGAAFAITVGTKFDEKWKSATKSTISFWATDPDGNSAAKLRQLQSGKIEDKTISTLWNSLSIEEKDSALNTAIDRANKAYDIVKSEKAKAEQERDDKIKTLKDEAYFAINKGDLLKFESIALKLDETDGGSEEANKLRKLTEPKDRVLNDPTTEAHFMQLELDDKLTREQVLEAVEYGKLNASTGKAYIKRIDSADDKQIKDALEYAKVATNYYQTLDQGAARQKVARLKQGLLNAKEAKPELDPMEWVKSQLDTVGKSVDSSAANDASAALRKFATENGIKANKNNKYDIIAIEKAIANSTAYSSMSDIQKRTDPIVRALDALRAQGLKEF